MCKSDYQFPNIYLQVMLPFSMSPYPWTVPVRHRKKKETVLARCQHSHTPFNTPTHTHTHASVLLHTLCPRVCSWFSSSLPPFVAGCECLVSGFFLPPSSRVHTPK